MTRSTAPRTPVLVTAALAAACTVGPDYQRPDLSARTDAAWRAPVGDAVVGQRTELVRWWQGLGSAELSAFAERLVAQNLSLEAARQRIVTARAQRGIVDAARLPQAGAGAGYVRAGTGNRGLNFQGPPPGKQVDVYSLSVTPVWELDLWGRVARLVEAADAAIDVSVEDYRDAAVALLAQLALAYVDAVTLHERIDVHARTVALLRATAGLAQSRLDAGNGTRFDVEQTRRELEQTEGQLPALQQALAAAENRIAVLLGERPRDGLVAAAQPLRLPAAIGIGVPADLLSRRADVRRRERQLAAAVAGIGAAEAERYPSVSIGGSFALRARRVDTLFDGADALSYSFGPGVTVPLLTGGRVDSAVTARSAEAEAARLAFEASVLEAVAEVEDAAVGVGSTRERLAHLERAAAAARRAVDLAQQLHAAGSRGLQPVLDAQRALAQIEDACVLAHRDALAQTIGLYRALGGGWEAVELTAGAAAPRRTGPGTAEAEEPR